MANVVKMDLNELDKISKGTGEAGSFCRTIHTQLQNRSTTLVPGQWEGAAATAFSKDMEETLKALDKLAAALEQAPAVMEKMARRLAEGHSQSKKYIEQAGHVFAGGGASAPDSASTGSP